MVSVVMVLALLVMVRGDAVQCCLVVVVVVVVVLALLMVVTDDVVSGVVE